MSALLPKGKVQRGGSKRASEAAAPSATDPRSGWKLFLGLAIALTADSLDLAFPTVSFPVDFVAALLLTFLYGLRWEILAILVPELFPATSLIPTWTMLVFYLAGIKR